MGKYRALKVWQRAKDAEGDELERATQSIRHLYTAKGSSAKGLTRGHALSFFTFHVFPLHPTPYTLSLFLIFYILPLNPKPYHLHLAPYTLGPFFMFYLFPLNPKSYILNPYLFPFQSFTEIDHV
jgi:hypothetical protein